MVVEGWHRSSEDQRGESRKEWFWLWYHGKGLQVYAVDHTLISIKRWSDTVGKRQRKYQENANISDVLSVL